MDAKLVLIELLISAHFHTGEHCVGKYGNSHAHLIRNGAVTVYVDQSKRATLLCTSVSPCLEHQM